VTDPAYRSGRLVVSGERSASKWLDRRSGARVRWGIEIACDESGFTGGNLAGGQTTVFAHASVRIGMAAAAALVDELRAELGGRAVEVKSRRVRRHGAAERVLAATAPDVRVHLTDPEFYVLARLADLAVLGPEVPGTQSPGTDPRAGALARALHAQGARVYGAQAWRALLRHGTDLMRTHNWRLPKDPVDAFFSHAGTLPRTGELDVLLRMRPAAVEWRAAHERNRKLTPLMEPVVPALARTAEAWLATATEIALVHDEQSALTRERLADIASAVARRLPGRRLVRVCLVDSRRDPRVQVADVLAGIARRAAGDLLAGRGDGALIAPYVLPGSTWAGPTTW
jgi:hypothetical protein